MLRTAIFGLGNVAERIHLPACQMLDGIQVIAASEPRADRRAEMQARFKIPKVYADSQALLAQEQPDLVIIGTPPDSHKDQCLQALRAGADVLCEKPFMLSVEDADQVIAEAKKLGRMLEVNTQYRYMTIYQTAQQQLARGAFGRPFFLQCWQQMFHPPVFEKLAWRAQMKQAVLYEFAPHALDLVCFFFDALPTAVSANIPRARSEYDSDVLVQMTLRFPDQRLATLALNRVSHAPERYLEMRLDCEKASLRLSLGGVARAAAEVTRSMGRSRPNLRVSFVKGGEVRVESGGRSRVLVRERQIAFASATAAHLRAFLAERASANRSYAAIEHAREILRVVFAGYESAATGKTVEL
jgi:predicted dehydrogenase